MSHQVLHKTHSRMIRLMGSTLFIVQTALAGTIIAECLLTTPNKVYFQAASARSMPNPRILGKVLDTLGAAFGLGTAVIERLPKPAPQVSLTQRQLYLVDSVRRIQYLYYQQYGYSVPLNAQNLGTLMTWVGAQPSEAEFVATAMYYFGSR